MGSGVVIAPDLVLTCSHVVAGSKDVAVGESETAAAVIVDDPRLDMALLESKAPLLDAPAPLAFLGSRRTDDKLVVRGYWADPEQRNVRSARIDWLGGGDASGFVQLTTAEGDPQLAVGMSGGAVELQIPSMNPGPIVGILVGREGVQSVHRGGWFLPVEAMIAEHPELTKFVARSWEFDDDWQIWSRRARGRLPGEDDGWFYVPHSRALATIASWWRDPGSADRLMLVVGQPGSGKSSLVAQLVAQSSPRFRQEALDAGEATIFELSDAPDAVLHLRNKTPESVGEALRRTPLRFDQPNSPRVVLDALDEARDPGRVADILTEELLRRGARVLSAQLPSAAALWRDRGPAIRVDLDSMPSEANVRAAVARRLEAAGIASAELEALAPQVTAASHGNHLVAALVADVISDERTDAGAFLGSASRAVGEAIRTYIRAKFVDLAMWQAAEPTLVALAFSEEPELALGETWFQLANACADELLGGQLGADAIEAAVRASSDFLTSNHRDEWSFFHNAFPVALRGDAKNQERFDRRIARDLIDAARRDDWARAPQYTLAHVATHAGRGGCLEELLSDLGFIESAAPDALANACYAYARRIEPALRERRVAVQQGVRGTQPGRSRATQLVWFGAVQRDDDLVSQLGSREHTPHVVPLHVRTTRLPDVDRTISDMPGLLSVVATTDTECAMWGLGTGGELRIFDGDGNWIRDVEGGHGGLKLVLFEGLSTRLVVGLFADGSIRSWDERGRPAALQVEEAHPGWILDATTLQSRDSSLLVTAGADGAVRSWTESGRPGPLHIERAHNGSVRGITTFRVGDEILIATVGRDRVLRSWRTDGTLGELDVADTHTSWVWDLAAVRDEEGSSLLITAGDDRRIRSWYHDGTPGLLQVEDAHAGRIYAAVPFSSHGQPFVVSGGTDGALRVWDLSNRLIDEAPRAHAGTIRSIATFDTLGDTRLLTGGADGALQTWRYDIRGSSALTNTSGISDAVPAAATRSRSDPRSAHLGLISSLLHIAPDLLISSGGDRVLRVWKEDGEKLEEVAAWTHPVLIRRLLRLSEERVIGVAADGSAEVWRLSRPGRVDERATSTSTEPTVDLEARELLQRISAASAAGPALMFAGFAQPQRTIQGPSDQASRHVLTIDATGRVTKWHDLSEPRPLDLRILDRERITALEAVEQDGRATLVAGFVDGSIRSWSLESGVELADQEAHAGAVRDLAVTWVDGEARLLTVGDDSYVKTWSLEDASLVFEFLTYEPASAVAESGLGRFAVGHVAGGLVVARIASP